MSELIERQAVIGLWDKYHPTIAVDAMQYDAELRQLPLAQPTQLTHDDMETIRVHLSAIKENLCNQHRWNEAKEYEALIDRLTAQLESNYDEWCTDCKEYDKEKYSCQRWNRVIRQTLQDAQPEPCEDAVSRKAVKDGFVEMCSLICPYTEKQRHTMCGSCLLGTAFDVLEATQPVTPKHGTGYWIPVGVAEVVGGESAQWGSAIAYHKCSECDEQALRDDFEQEVLSRWCPYCGVKMEKWSDD